MKSKSRILSVILTFLLVFTLAIPTVLAAVPIDVEGDFFINASSIAWVYNSTFSGQANGLKVSGSTATSTNNTFRNMTGYGIYITDSGALTMVAGASTGNAVGVYVSSNSSLTVSGAVNISGNTTSNVYLDGSLITLGELTSGASIGVTTDTKPTATSPVQITEASEAYYSTALQYFFSDSYLYVVCANDTGKYLELQLADYEMTLGGTTAADTGNFGSICVDEAAAQSFTITNTGSNVQLSGVAVALSGDDAASFTLDTTALSTTLAVGGTTSFSISPVENLTAGTYKATITVSANYVEAQTVEVTLTVTEHSTETQNAKDATCTEDGYTGDEVCTVCGETITTGTVIPATGHSYIEEVIAPSYAEQGYTLHTCENCGESYQTDSTAILVLDGTDSSVTTQVTVGSLTSLDGELPNIYSSVDELIADLVSRVTVTAGYTEENTAVYDVYLQYSVDGGAWAAATVDNFPTTGITVTLPYPDGTDASYSFTVLHMFTESSTRLGITAGETESPTVTKTDDGLVVTLTGLSPVTISWQAPTTTTTTTTSPATGDNGQIALWLGLMAVSGVGIVGLTAYSIKRRRFS